MSTLFSSTTTAIRDIFDETTRAALNTVVAQQPYPLVFMAVSGSHLYGFHSEDSDIDLRGVHVLPITDLLGLRKGREIVEQTTIHDGRPYDLVTHEIRSVASFSWAITATSWKTSTRLWWCIPRLCTRN